MFFYLALAFFAFASAYSIVSNRDWLSPSKYLIGFTMLYMAGIFLTPVPDYVYLSFIFYMLVAMGLSWRDRAVPQLRAPQEPVSGRPEATRRQMVAESIFFWALTLVPVVLLLMLINLNGGFCAFLNSIASRVLAWSGMGFFVKGIELMPIINFFYFHQGLVARHRSKIWWILYGVHLTLLLLMSLMHGSRSALLAPLLILILIYNYVSARVGLVKLALTGAAIFVVAIGLGAVRNQIKCDTQTGAISLPSPKVVEKHLSNSADSFTRRAFKMPEKGSDNSSTIVSSLFPQVRLPLESSYGIMGLSIVGTNSIEPLWGLTFATCVTDLVPRSWWPGKPDNAAVAITKLTAQERYTGRTHLTPGIIAESILNFGHVPGYIIGLILFVLVAAITQTLYHAIVSRKAGSLWFILMYIYTLNILASLSKGTWGIMVSGWIVHMLMIAFLALLCRFVLRRLSGEEAGISR